MDDAINCASNPLHSVQLNQIPIQNRSEARIRNRAAHEERRLLKNSSRSLAKHILGLLDDQEHSDLVIECGPKNCLQTWHCHSILLLARTPRLHSVLLSRFQLPKSDSAADQRRRIRLPALLLAQFEFSNFLRCLYSGQDVNSEQLLLLNHLRRLPSVDQDLDAFALDLPPLTQGYPSSVTMESMDQTMDQTMEEPLYVNLVEIHTTPPLPSSSKIKPTVDKQPDQQELIQLNSESDLLDVVLHSNNTIKQKSELSSLPVTSEQVDSGLPEFTSSHQEDIDTKDTETEQLFVDTTLNSQLLIQLATEDQLLTENPSNEESTKPVDELFLKSNSNNQIKTGHTMSTLSDVSEITDVQSAQEIVDRMLHVNRSIDLQQPLDMFQQEMLEQESTNETESSQDQHVMARLNSFDSADSADLLEKLTRIELEEQQWRLQLQLEQDLLDGVSATTSNVFGDKKQQTNSIGRLKMQKDDLSASKATLSTKNADQERVETPASSSSMIRSGTFDLLTYKNQNRKNGSKQTGSLYPNNVSESGNAESEQLLLECDDHTEQQLLERTLIESPQCMMQNSLHLGNIPPPPPPPAAVRRSVNALKNSNDSRSSLNRRIKSAHTNPLNNPENSSTDFDAANRGFMFISIEDEAVVDDSFNHLLTSPFDNSSALIKSNQNPYNTFERRKQSKRSRSAGQQRAVTECAECGSSGCGSECEEQRRLLHTSLLSCSKLGEDLLWLFLLQTDCDTKLLVEEGKRWLGAHQCILAARSEFLRKKLVDAKLSNVTVAPLNSNDELKRNSTTQSTQQPTDSESSPEELNASDDSPVAETELLDDGEQNFLIAPQPALLSLDCLVDFSFPACHFALCHIYSGTLVLPNFAHSPDFNTSTNNDQQTSATVGSATTGTSSLPYANVPLAELLHLCELLQLPHLHQAIVAAIRHHLCHQFHSPCSKCLSGVCQTVKLSERCDLVALHSSCIRWLAKHFVNICTHKCFVELLANERPLDSINRKNHSANNHYNKTSDNVGATGISTGTIGKRPKLSVCLLEAIQERLDEKNVLDTALALQRAHALVSQLRNRSQQQLLQLVQRALDTCVQMIGDQMDAILCGESFDRMLQCHAWQIEPLQMLFDLAIDTLDTDGACRAMCALEQLFALYNPNEQQHLQHPQQPFGFSRSCLEEPQLQLLRYLRKRIERLLVQRANEAVYCESWSLLSNGLQHHIQSTAMLVFEFEKPLAKRPLLSSSMRKTSRNEQSDQGSLATNANDLTNVALATELASRSQHGSGSPRRVPSTISGKSNLPSIQKKSNTQQRFLPGKDKSLAKQAQPKANEKTSRLKKPQLRNLEQAAKINDPNHSLTTTADSDEEAHIYDEVPFDLQQIVAEKQSIGKNGHAITLIEYRNDNKSDKSSVADNNASTKEQRRPGSQVVKVSPYKFSPFITNEPINTSSNSNDNLIQFSVNENLHQSINENQENLYENLRDVSGRASKTDDRIPVTSLLKQADQLHQRLSQKLNEVHGCPANPPSKAKSSNESKPKSAQRSSKNGQASQQRNVVRTSKTAGNSASKKPPFK